MYQYQMHAYMYIYKCISILYLNFTPTISNHCPYAHHSLISWCFNHLFSIVEPSILIATFSFSGYIWPNCWICLVEIPTWCVFNTFCHSLLLVGEYRFPIRALWQSHKLSAHYPAELIIKHPSSTIAPSFLMHKTTIGISYFTASAMTPFTTR